MTVDAGLTGSLQLMPETLVEEIVQNVRMIMGTWRGSVPLDREFGLNAELLDAPMNAAKSRMTADLAAQIAKCEPRARLKELTFEADGAEGILMPRATLVIGE